MCPGLLPNRENVNLFLSNALAQYEPFQQGTQTMRSAIERDINGRDSNGKHAISMGWSCVALKLHISEHSVCYMVVLLAMRPMLYGLRLQT